MNDQPESPATGLKRDTFTSMFLKGTFIGFLDTVVTIDLQAPYHRCDPLLHHISLSPRPCCLNHIEGRHVNVAKAVDPPIVEAVSLIRTMRGGSQSALLRGNDGHCYVTKFFNNPQGPNLLANEWIGTALARAVGLPVSPVARINVARSMIDSDERLVFHFKDGCTKRDAGLHFGSRFLAADNRIDRPVDYLPTSQRKELAHPSQSVGIALFDMLTTHCDTRQALFWRHSTTRKVLTTFIDFGHVFGGPHWTPISPKWPLWHYDKSYFPQLWTERAVFGWISKFQDKIPQAFTAARAEIPRHWYAGDITRIEDNLARRLDIFPAIIRSLLFHKGTAQAVSIFHRLAQERYS